MNQNKRNNYQSNRGGRRGFGRNKGRGWFQVNWGSIVCQVCYKPRHVASHCFHRFDHSFQLGFSSFSQPHSQQQYLNSLRSMETIIASHEYLYDSSWFPNLSASCNVTVDLNNVLQGSEYNGPKWFHMGNGTGLSINKIGHSFMRSPLNSYLTSCLKNLLYVPSITETLVSVSTFAKDNLVFF